MTPLEPDFLPHPISRAREKLEHYRWALERYGSRLDSRQCVVMRRYLGLDGPPLGRVRLGKELGVTEKMVDKIFARARHQLLRGIEEEEKERVLASPGPLENYSGLKRKPYGTDLTDEEWHRIAFLLPDIKPAFRHVPAYSFREFINAMLYKAHTGRPWKRLPEHFPSRDTIRYYYEQWRDDGRLERMSDLLGKDLSAAFRPYRRKP